jgi:phosphoribosylglycinamide formyltransferase-1
MRLAFLASGGGGTIRFLHHALRLVPTPIEIVGVIADRACGAVETAAALAIPVSIIGYRQADPTGLRQGLATLAADVVVTNIHKILDAETLVSTPARFVNLHYSLLPDFAGLIGMATVEAARSQGARSIGATCHEVVEAVDAGPILGQCAFAVDWSQDLDDLKDVVFRGACLTLLAALLRMAGGVGDGPESSTSIKGREVRFNPGLGFDAAQFDEGFWTTVRA